MSLTRLYRHEETIVCLLRMYYGKSDSMILLGMFNAMTVVANELHTLLAPFFSLSPSLLQLLQRINFLLLTTTKTKKKYSPARFPQLFYFRWVSVICLIRTHTLYKPKINTNMCVKVELTNNGFSFKFHPCLWFIRLNGYKSNYKSYFSLTLTHKWKHALCWFNILTLKKDIECFTLFLLFFLLFIAKN